MKYLYAIFLISFIQFLNAQDLDKMNKLIDNWHLFASQAKFQPYFDFLSENAIFIGTAPNERWTKKEFMDFSKPYFDKGKAWDFKCTERNWNFSADKKTAWFDEKLATWMEDCRGSGVLVLENKVWKLVFYDLHVIIENEKIYEFINLRRKK